MNIKHMPRHQLKSVKNSVREGRFDLKIVGSKDSGYRLAAKTAASNLIVLHGPQTTLAAAVATGKRKYGIVASQVRKPRKTATPETAAA